MIRIRLRKSRGRLRKGCGGRGGRRTHFSQVVVLAGPGSGANLVYPNPTRNTATLQTGDNNLLNRTARLFDMNGRVAGAWVVTGGAQVPDLGYLCGGVYLLQLADGQTLKIIKE